MGRRSLRPAGAGKTTSQSTAIEVPIVAVVAGFWHVVALDRADGVWAWATMSMARSARSSHLKSTRRRRVVS